ncbi:MAG: sugar transferase [Lachnospiraceae bacterium]
MYRKAAKGWMKHFDFMIIDVFCLELSYLFAYCIRNGFNNPWEKTLYRSMFMLFLMADIIAIGYCGSFKNTLERGYYREWVMTFKHVCLVMLSGTFFLFITQMGSLHSRVTLILTTFFYFLTSYINRILWKKHLISKGVLMKGKTSFLIITTSEALKGIVAEIKKDQYDRFYMPKLAIIDLDMTGQTVEGIPIVANLDTAAEYVCREWIDEVFVKLPPDIPQCNDFINQFVEMGVAVHLNLFKIDEFGGQKRTIERIGPYTVLTTSINMMTIKESFAKRFLDICGGIIGCILTGVLFLIIAPCIYIKSPGPILFSQIRVGQNGKKFRLYKFRSMYLDAEERKKELMEKNCVNDGLMFKLDYDPRIIGSENGKGRGIGSFIRKYSLDEFPQFWNVLKGDMSLVGTRPPTLDEWEKYALHHRARLAIKPGITGMWQVSGRSDITDFEEVVKMDTSYIKAWSVGLDIKILIKTVFAVLGQNGAM